MFQKLHRLSKSQDIRRVMSKGKEVSGLFLLFRWLENKEHLNRIAIIISLKVKKEAVVRNKIRRVIREYVRNKNFQIKQGYNIVVICRPGIDKFDNKEISQQVDFLLKESGLL